MPVVINSIFQLQPFEPVPGTARIPVRKSIFLLLCLVAVGLTSLGSRAGDFQPWGVYLSLADATSKQNPQAKAPSVAQQLESSRARIESARQSMGPYSPELGELLRKAAREAEEYGEADKALDLYQQALFTTRINQGLYAAAQIPILENMLDILRHQGDAKGVASRLDYYYHLFGQGARPYSPERLEASVRWLSVNTELLGPEEFRGSESKVVRVWEHAERLTSDVCLDPKWSGDWCKPLTLQSLALLYLIDWRIDPLVTEQYGAGVTKSSASYGREWDLSPLEQRLYAVERMALSKAREILTRAMAIAPNDTDLMLAEADLQWVAGRRSSALDLYRELQKGHPEWFEQPAPLPSYPGFFRDPRLVAESGMVAVSLRVTEYGAPRDIVVTEQEGSDSSIANFARRQLRELRFRPVLDKSGEPVESEWTSNLQVMR